MQKQHLTQGILLSEIATRLKGELIGDPKTQVFGICSFGEPLPRHLSFLKGLSLQKSSIERLRSCGCAGILLQKSDADKYAHNDFNFILVDDPLLSLVSLVPLFFTETDLTQGISEKADVHPSARIGINVSIGAFSVIGSRVVIEDQVTIHPQVVIYPEVHISRGSIIHSGAIIREGCHIGEESIIYNGAIIGCDGFGYIVGSDEKIFKVPQVGTTVIGKNVEVGANTCIDRATLGTTNIGESTKIDNLVQVGHNTRIGNHSLICALTGIAGSANIGNYVTLGGQSGVGNHISITDRVRVAAKSGVVHNIKEGGDYSGYPAVKVSVWRKQIHILNWLATRAHALKKIFKESSF